MQASEAFMGWRGVTVCEQMVRSMVLLGAVAWVGVVLQAAGGGVVQVVLQAPWVGLEYFQGKFPHHG